MLSRPTFIAAAAVFLVVVALWMAISPTSSPTENRQPLPVTVQQQKTLNQKKKQPAAIITTDPPLVEPITTSTPSPTSPRATELTVPVFKLKRLEMSSAYGDEGPMLALDGEIGTYFHTDSSGTAWWEFETTAPMNVTEIVIYHRRDCCAHRFSNIQVELFRDDRRIYQSDSQSPQDKLVMRLEKISIPVGATRLRISRGFGPVDGFFHLAEVHVFVNGNTLRAAKFLPPPDANFVELDEKLAPTWRQETARLFRLIKTVARPCKKPRVLGGPGDGAWTACFDDLEPRFHHGCTVYSIGSAGDFSFDDAIANLGCEVHTFDPTMGWAPTKVQRGPNRYQYGIGIAGTSSDSASGYKMGAWAGQQRWKVRSLPDLMHWLHHGSVDVLKMDVEGNEWPVLESIAQNAQTVDIQQLLFEIHFWPAAKPSTHHLQSHSHTHRWYRVLLALTKYYDLFTYHANPMSSEERMPHTLPCCHELGFMLNKNSPFFRS
eukprot:PhM_4_TR7802/c0_g1_i6/m.69697